MGQWFYREYTGFYRPLTALLWKINYALWGLAPFGYQLTNLLLHTGCALLLWHITYHLFPDSRRAGLWAALLFLFLPGHIFGVLMIAALTGLLCSLFYLGSVALYLHGRRDSRLCETLSLLVFLLALMTKELAASLPLVILSWETVLLLSERRFTLRRWIRIGLPYFVLLVTYMLFRYLSFGHLAQSPLHTFVSLHRLLINAAIYSAKIFAPWGLENLKPFFRAHPTLLAAVSVTGLALAAFLVWRYRHPLQAGHLLCLFWIPLTMLPVIQLYSPWNTYLPSVGSAMFIVGLVQAKKRGKEGPPPRTRTAILGLLLFLFVGYSLPHQFHWREARQLCKRVLDGVVSAAAERSGQIYLANLPAELNETPLFVGDWGLHSAMRLRGQPATVEVLTNVIKTEIQEAIKTSLVGEQKFELMLPSPGDFFRLETVEILSKKRRPEMGYSYRKGEFRVTVRGFNRQGEANQLEIDMGDPQKLKQVMVWDGNGLIPLVTE